MSVRRNALRFWFLSKWCASSVNTRVFGLDVLRAFAIVSVLWLHSFYYRARDVSVISGDGVAVFFVLSGYLVGGLMLQHIRRGGGVLEFLVRRWLRTLPAYVAVLSVLAVLYGRRLPVDYLVFAQNLAGFEGSWFVESWSLAVEEWFYLAFTAGVFALSWCRVAVRRASMLTAVVLVLLSVAYTALREFDQSSWVHRVRFSVFAQLGSIAAGVLLALMLERRPGLWRAYRGRVALVGLMLFYVSYVAVFGGMWGPGVGLVLLPVYSLGVVFVLPWALGLARWSGVAGQLVEFVSAHAYALYLVNWSLVDGWLLRELDFARYGLAVEVAAFWLCSVLLAVLLRRGVELPFLALRDRWSLLYFRSAQAGP